MFSMKLDKCDGAQSVPAVGPAGVSPAEAGRWDLSCDDAKPMGGRREGSRFLTVSLFPTSNHKSLSRSARCQPSMVASVSPLGVPHSYGEGLDTHC